MQPAGLEGRQEPAGAYAGRAQHGLALSADGAVGWSDISDGIYVSREGFQQRRGSSDMHLASLMPCVVCVGGRRAVQAAGAQSRGEPAGAAADRAQHSLSRAADGAV